VPIVLAWRLYRVGRDDVITDHHPELSWLQAEQLQTQTNRDRWQEDWDYRSYLLWREGRTALSQRWWPTDGPVLSRRVWGRLRRFQLARYAGVTAAQDRLTQAAKDLRAARARHSWLDDVLNTPMVFPPAHPGCDEPIYPNPNATADGLGEGWHCRTHGDVTASVMDFYYGPQTSQRKARR
jgi:hypothetical protein